MGNDLSKQRDYRRKTGNASTKRYEKTKPGFLMRLYRNMQSRVGGVNASKAHLYLGLDILPRQDFYDWANASTEFHRLWSKWKASGMERRLTPSVDRIDPSRGYSIDNMEWVTFSENCRRGTVRRNEIHGNPARRSAPLAASR